VSGDGWLVEQKAAYEAWVHRYRPTLDDELTMTSYLESWVSNRPPTAEPDDRGNRRVNGPSGCEIVFRREDAPSGGGFVLVMRIG